MRERSFEAYYDRGKEAFRVILGVIFAAGMIWAAMNYSEGGGGRASIKYAWALPWLPWLGALVAAFVAVNSVRHVFDRSPQLVINDDGLIIRKWRKALIPWDAIRSCSVMTFGKQKKLLCFHLHSPADYPAEGGMAIVAFFNRLVGVYAIYVGDFELDRRFDDIFAAIRQYVPEGQAA